MSIGLVMFWKAVVVTLWAVAVERWDAFRQKRAGEGLPLKLNRKTGVYQVRDWTAGVNKAGRVFRNTVYSITLVLWAGMAGYWLFW